MKKSLPIIKLSLAALLSGTAISQAQTTDTWNGSGADANWTTAANWSLTTAPNPGDSLIFDGSTQTTPNNDFAAGTLFGGIAFAPTALPFTLTGNSILLTGLVVNDATNQFQTIELPLVLTNSVTFNTASNDLNGGVANDISIANTISGTGSLTKTGNGTLFLGTSSYSGGTVVNGGLLVVSNLTGGYTMSGGGLMLNFRTYYTGLNLPFTADSSVGVDLLDNTEPVGVDDAGTIGTAGFKLTKIGQGLLRITGSINASSIDVANGTLGSLGGGLGGGAGVEPLTKLGTAPITVENGAMARFDDGGVCPNAITLNGGDGTSVGGVPHRGALISSARNNGGSTTNFNIFTNTITLAADSTIGSYYNTMIISGNITGPGGLTKIGANPMLLSGSNSFNGALNIGLYGTSGSGGTVQIGSSNAIPANATVTINANSKLDINGQAITVWAISDDNSKLGVVDNSSASPASLTFASSATYYGSVLNSGGGALSIVNAGGSVYLDGVNQYTGATLAEGGTMDMNIPTGASASGLLVATNNATLTLHFTAPSQTFKSSGATLGNNSSDSVTLNVDLFNYGNSSKPVINATNGSGILSANGTITVNFNNPANLSVGQFPIVKYTSRIGSGSFVLNPISGITALIVTNAANSSIDLKITSAPITTWKGNKNNLWDSTTTNWTYSGTPVLYSDGSAVFFDDTALTNIVNLTGPLSPGSVLMNSTNTYLFNGTGPLGGGTLTKNGSGTLILDVVGNSFASTVIGGGTLQVGNNDNLGDLGSGNVDDEGTLSFNLTNNYSVPGVISGLGAIVKNNTNTVTLSQANTYSGGTTVNQGALKLGNNTSLGVPSGTLAATVASGAALDLGGKQVAAGYVTINGPGLTATSGSLFTTAGMGCTIGCTPVGVKYLRLAGNASIGDSSGDFQLGIDANANGQAGVASIDGQGFVLTKIGANTLVLEATNLTALSQFIITSGGVEWANSARNPLGTTCSVLISNNAFINTWDNFQNTGVSVANNFTIGLGGGRFLNNHGTYFTGPCKNTFSGAFSLIGNLSVTANIWKDGIPGQMNFTGPLSGFGGVVNSCPTNAPVNLAGINTYSGPTIVTNTSYLQLSTMQQGGGSYLVYDNSTLDVPLQNGYSNVPMSTLMIGSSVGGNISFARIANYSTTNAPVMATNLTVLGTGAVLLPPTAYAVAGQFPLIKYGTFSGGGTLVAGAAGVRGTPAYISNNVANSSIDLVVPGGNPVTWVGNLNNIWDINNNSNFKYLGSSTPYLQAGSLGDSVTFDDSSTVTNVNLSVLLSPTVALVNTTNTYTFFGTNLTGAASLSKNGNGTLVLSNFNNPFTGGTLVNSGTLRMATRYSPLVAMNNLSGTVTVAAGATLDIGSNNPTAMIINIAGSGVGGNGAVQANYAGPGAANGPSIINLVSNASIGGNNRWDLRNGSKQLNASQPGTTLTKVGSGYTALVGAIVSTNVSDITILGGTFGYQTTTPGLGNTNGTIYVGGSGTLEFYQATVPLIKNIVCSNGASLWAESGNSLSQNIIAGPVNLVNGTTTVKGNFYNGLVISNTISGAGSLALQFQSYLYLAASNTFTGTLTVPDCNASNGGLGTRLSLLGNGSVTRASSIIMQGITSSQAYAGFIDASGRVDGTLTLGTNQLLRGDNGSFVRGNVVAAPGSGVDPGGINNTNYQYMTFSNSLTMRAGSTNFMCLYKASTFTSNDLVNVIGTLTNNGAVLFIGTNGAVTPFAAGDAFKLFNAGAYVGSFAQITPGPGAGLIWDASQLSVNGTLSVKPVSVSPASTNIVYGNDVQLSASTTSGGTLSYQWYDNNNNAIVGANGATLTLTKPAVSASGNYTLVITNGSTFAGAAAAAVTISQAPLTIGATNINKNLGVSYVFTGKEFTNSALVAGDSVTSVTLTSAGSAGAALVGAYPIVPSAAVGAGLVNYNISYVSGTLAVVQTMPAIGTNLNLSVIGNTLNLSWPTNYIGWLLQSNSVDLANTNNWFTVPGSDTNSSESITLDPAKNNVFYRMIHP